MKKISYTPLPFDPRRVIVLDESQLAIYKNGYLDIVTADGELLTTVGKVIDRGVESFERETAIDNLYLLDDLMRNAVDGLELSSRGTLGLANMVWQAKEMIE